MLQQADLSVIETVMRNVVVFARMRSHQKGQVMDLLGKRGLHHPYMGQPRHIPVSTFPANCSGFKESLLCVLFLCNNCFGSQENVLYIEWSLLRGAIAVRIQYVELHQDCLYVDCPYKKSLLSSY